MPEYQSVQIKRHAQYLKIGTLTKQTKYIWFGLHGYGQTADYIAHKLDFLDKEENLVICPEGLNKFYWHDNDKPVACWMTKRHRYEEIDDFVGYLDALYNRYCKHVHHDTKIIFFAFSQGCATLWRWLHATQPRFNVLINWAGWIPEDISYLHLEDYLADKKMYLRYGNSDQYMDAKMIKMLEDVIKKSRLQIDIDQFEGKHNIPSEEIQKFTNLYVNTKS